MSLLSNDPAFYLASRARDLYALSPRARFRELLRICRKRKITVILDPELDREGWFVSLPRPTIFLKRRRAWVLAHELFHAWITENITAGIVYPYSDYADDNVEQAAERFACLLCGSFSKQAQTLLAGK